MKELNKENYPVVLSGDFNLTEETEPLKIIAGEMKDSFTIAKTIWPERNISGL